MQVAVKIGWQTFHSVPAQISFWTEAGTEIVDHDCDKNWDCFHKQPQPHS
jgi:hypothetical protein